MSYITWKEAWLFGFDFTLQVSELVFTLENVLGQILLFLFFWLMNNLFVIAGFVTPSLASKVLQMNMLLFFEHKSSVEEYICLNLRKRVSYILQFAKALVDCPTQLICTWIFICVPWQLVIDKAKRTQQGDLLRRHILIHSRENPFPPSTTQGWGWTLILKLYEASDEGVTRVKALWLR